MKAQVIVKTSAILLLASGVSSCASTGDLLSAPQVSLSNMEVTDLDFSSQTFRLGFDVSNPNPFPLPVTSVSYGVELDGLQFAAGATEGSFTVPANGDSEFAINVRLNLLKTAPHLLYTVRDGVSRPIPYALKGRLGVDIPFAPSVKFESHGEIRLQDQVAKRHKSQ